MVLIIHPGDYAIPSDRTMRDLRPDDARRLARIRRLAWLIDGSARLPGTTFRFGLNSLIGLVPAGGDAVLAGLSMVIVWEAHKLGVPRPVLARMVANIGIEAIGGAIPIAGDAFDMVFKANLRNVALIEDYLRRARS